VAFAYPLLLWSSIVSAQLTIVEMDRRVVAHCSVAANNCYDFDRQESVADGFSAFHDSVSAHTTQCAAAGASIRQQSTVGAGFIQFSAAGFASVREAAVYSEIAIAEAVAKLRFHVSSRLDYALDAEGVVVDPFPFPAQPSCVAELKHPNGTIEGLEVVGEGSGVAHRRGTLIPGDYDLIFKLTLGKETFGPSLSATGLMTARFEVTAPTAVLPMQWQDVKMLYRE